MGWSRLPTYFANIPLKLMPFSEAQQKAYEATGFVKQIAFQTVPSVNKVELKQYLEKVYGLRVKKVNTLIYEGKKKRSSKGFYTRTDYKKAYVTLKDPPKTSA